MSFKHDVRCECDWCEDDLKDGASVACKKCHEDLEQKVSDLEQEISNLKEKISSISTEVRYKEE